MSDFLSPYEHEARTMEFRRVTIERLRALLRPGVPILEIAQLLGAEDLLTVEQVGRGKNPIYRFDAQTFVQREIDRGTFLRLPDNFEKLATTLIPSDEAETIRRGSGEGIEEKNLIPRSQYLVEALTELNQPYQVVSGTNTAGMVRGESYQAFIVPGLEKIVLVNNEEGNATFIVFARPEEYATIVNLTKGKLRSLGEEKVQALVFSGNPKEWKEQVSELLTRQALTEVKVVVESEEPNLLSGWLTNKALARELGVNPDTTKLIVSRYIAAHPELFSKYIYRSGAAKYLHPELVSHIRTEVANRTKAPEGWQPLTSLVDKADKKTIQHLIDKNLGLYGKKEEDWVGSYVDVTGKHSKHLHPELIKLVAEELDGRETAPEGWLTNHALSEILKKEQEAGKRIIHRRATIREVIKKYRGTNPEWFKTFKTNYFPSFLKEHFHPDLVEIIKKELTR